MRDNSEPIARKSGDIWAVIPLSAVDHQFSDRLLGHLRKGGDIVHHQTEREDKTGEVIDAEARIKNTTELRDRLRSMLGRHTANLKDLIEVERELARVQCEVDSLLTRRKILANETEKVAVNVEFRAKPSIGERGVFAPVVEAWHGAGRLFAWSLSMVITVIVGVIPWFIIIMPGIWVISRFGKRIFKRRQDKKIPAQQKNKE